MWHALSPPAERPVDLEYLGHVRGQARAVSHQHAQLLHLGEGAPVEVGRPDVEVFPVHQPELGVQHARPHQLVEVQAANLGPELGQVLCVAIGLILPGLVLSNLQRYIGSS